MRLPLIGLLSATALTVSAVISLAQSDAETPAAVIRHYNSYHYDAGGMWSIHPGTVKHRDHSMLEGAGIRDLAAAPSSEAQKILDALMQASLSSLKAIKAEGSSSLDNPGAVTAQ